MGFFDGVDDFLPQKSAWFEITDAKGIVVTVSVDFTSVRYKGWTKPGVLSTPGPLSATSWGSCQTLVYGLKLSDSNSGWAVLAGIPAAPLFETLAASHGTGYCDSKNGSLSSGWIKWRRLAIFTVNTHTSGHGQLQ